MGLVGPEFIAVGVTEVEDAGPFTQYAYPSHRFWQLLSTIITLDI